MSDAFKVAYQVFGESSARGYERIRKQFNKILPYFKIPSSYILNKRLPLQAIYCLFELPIDENEEEKEKEDLIYGTKRLDIKVDDEDDIRNVSMLTNDHKNGWCF